ncbi:N-acetylmuramoyl-L-alanine amidase [Flavobacterium cyanobacteriorum]|uniref:N-acetylmuramoyl-L-alanine amidase n=2 Tax=Flavobacterium cyanobacteriorum TaxID=2022802 RepID=A0A255YVF5_9FLAO|nr:N-acetylmuramoyl-L-alanine amidase [Flavobacterium cyanobacteriorum]
MKGNRKIKLALLFFIAFSVSGFAQMGGKFKVVLDAGHGGKDYGAIYHGFIEKNIALNVALKVGKILEKDPGVQVIYTRKTDVFIELIERPNIANKADAHVFVSIHCNGEAKKSAFGTETFVIGNTKNASNLEVAKKENSVIILEKDSKTKYAGFDPNSPETLIGLVAQQEAYINQSIDLASKVQDNFTEGLKRKSRGVKQAPFWVLHKTAMPSILIELGFLSYKQEGEYLNSEEGQEEIAEAIARAILDYKKEYPASINVADDETPRRDDLGQPATNKTKPAETKSPEPDKEDKPLAKGTVFKVQISASGRDLELKPSNFKGLNNITKDASTSVIKYFYGETSNYSEAKQLLEEAKEKGFTSAFVVAFRDGKKVSVQEALK